LLQKPKNQSVDIWCDVEWYTSPLSITKYELIGVERYQWCWTFGTVACLGVF